MQELNLVAVYGSPRRNGNSATLLKHSVQGAREAGARVDEFVLRDLKIAPCYELYGCKHAGECRIRDDFQMLRDRILASDGLLLASPIFFYTVSAHTKMFMDRFQSLWVKKYWSDAPPDGSSCLKRQGLFIAVGATKGKRLFDGTLLTVRYFFDVLDMALWKALTYRGLDLEGDVLKFPKYLKESYNAGREMVEMLRSRQSCEMH